MECTRKEFAELAGCSPANLTTYIGRGKVFLMKDGKRIDTTRRENSDFLKKREAMGKAKGSVPVSDVKQADVNDSHVIKPTGKVRKAAEKSALSKYTIETEKLQADLDKKLVDTEIAQQKLSTMIGNNVSVDLVKNIIAQLSKSAINNYKSFTEQGITEFCHKHRVSDTERAAMIAKNTIGINAIHRKFIEDARIQLKNVVGIVKVDEDEEEK